MNFINHKILKYNPVCNRFGLYTQEQWDKIFYIGYQRIKKLSELAKEIDYFFDLSLKNKNHIKKS